MYAGIGILRVFHQSIHLSVLCVISLCITSKVVTVAEVVMFVLTFGTLTVLTTFPCAMIGNQAVVTQSVFPDESTTVVHWLCLETSAFEDEMLTGTEGAFRFVAVVLLKGLLLSIT